MQLQYRLFFKENGVRRLEELISPRLNLFKGFPRNTIYHHFTPDLVKDDNDLFPDPDKSYFQGYQQRLPLQLVSESSLMEGNPRKVPFQPERFVSQFLRNNKVFRYIRSSLGLTADERTLIVVDYNPLKIVYNYIDTELVQYTRWVSLYKSFWNGISQAAKESNREHFVLIEPIKDIPSLSMLNNYGDNKGSSLLHLFNTTDKKIILHLVNYLKEETRQNSALSVIDPATTKKINLVFMLQDGRCSVINLGYLLSWIKGNPNVTEFRSITQREPDIVIRSFLKYLLVVSSVIPEDAVEQLPESLENKQEDEQLEEDELERNIEKNEGFATGFRPSSKIVIPSNSGAELPVKLPASDVKEDLGSDVLASLNVDLEILEQQNKEQLVRRGLAIKNGNVVETTSNIVDYKPEEVKAEVYKTLTPHQALLNKLKKALDNGTLNAAGYKKAVADSEKYLKMQDPYGTGAKVTDKIVIDPKALLLNKDKTKLIDQPTILDKSMTESTLQDYTSGYIKNHHRNDILKAVGALQKGGVTIQRHEVNIEHSIMGSVEVHNLELKPVNGVSSSVWFKLPVVNEDGTYVVAGNRYLMRKQRVDLPIRKISSTEVSLNSYYGKAFVSTENKSSGNEVNWILNQIEKASFEGSDWIKSVIPGDTFNSERKTPLFYGAISTRFRTIETKELTLWFDGTTVRSIFPDAVKARIAKGMVVCGVSDKNVIFMDTDNRFYELTDKGLVDIGDIYSILKLDSHKAPIRYSELALFRKNVPVGLVLGYKLGWSKLLALLNVKPRFVEPKKRLSLEPHEYPIPFLDGVYVFSRKDRFATMVLAGFMEYSKTTKGISVKQFENQDVYLNLLASKGLGAIYIREIDMLFDYFVDPITEEILKDMNEPTNFEGLLLRSTEMLLDYSHPKPYDGSLTRIRGYERFSGSVYREMTAVIRQFRAKNISGRSKIDISPYKVWQSLNEDPTKMMVPNINPIQELKNDEGVTYVGEGGRSADGMNKASRSFHVNDTGVVSEGTVDSSDVGINIYSSSNPKLKNYRGLKSEESEVSSSNRHCSAVLLAPGATHDD